MRRPKTAIAPRTMPAIVPGEVEVLLAGGGVERVGFELGVLLENASSFDGGSVDGVSPSPFEAVGVVEVVVRVVRVVGFWPSVSWSGESSESSGPPIDGGLGGLVGRIADGLMGA